MPRAGAHEGEIRGMIHMSMKTRVLEETKTNFEKELEGHEADGWIPQWATKGTVVVLDHQEGGDGSTVFFDTQIIHTIVLQKWED
jgi:hypothetical protein